jgi:hypothetical protein
LTLCCGVVGDSPAAAVAVAVAVQIMFDEIIFVVFFFFFAFVVAFFILSLCIPELLLTFIRRVAIPSEASSEP